MANFHSFTSLRTTAPDGPALLSSLRGLDPTAGFRVDGPVLTVDKDTPWTAAQISAAQTAIDTAPASTPQLTAQEVIDALPIETKALVLALIDQLNVIRAALPVPLPPIGPGQALAAIRAKAGTL